jgi:hypothetical protein
MRYQIQRDEVGLYIMLFNAFLVRPMEKTDLFIDEKVMVQLDMEKDPFVYIYKLKGNIKEYWVNCGFVDTADKAEQYEFVKTTYQKQFLQLRA